MVTRARHGRNQSVDACVVWAFRSVLAVDRSAEVNPQSVVPYRSSTFDSPIGVLKLVASSSGLAAVLWENDNPKRVRLARLPRTRPMRIWSRRSGS